MGAAVWLSCSRSFSEEEDIDAEAIRESVERLGVCTARSGRRQPGFGRNPFRITVRLDSGSTLIVEDTRDINLRVGDRVRVENDHIYRM